MQREKFVYWDESELMAILRCAWHKNFILGLVWGYEIKHLLSSIHSLDGQQSGNRSRYTFTVPNLVVGVLYRGVCISDMVPFYAGRLAAKSGTANRIHEKVSLTKCENPNDISGTHVLQIVVSS